MTFMGFSIMEQMDFFAKKHRAKRKKFTNDQLLTFLTEHQDAIIEGRIFSSDIQKVTGWSRAKIRSVCEENDLEYKKAEPVEYFETPKGPWNRFLYANKV